MSLKYKGDNKVALFDLDLTITNTDTFRLFLKKYYLSSPLLLHKLLYVFIFGVLRKLRFISLRKFKENSLIGLKGASIADISGVGSDYFDRYLKATIRQPAKDAMRYYKDRGYKVLIISASPDIYVQAFSDYLSCDGYLCTELEYFEESFTGNISGEDCIGEEKRKRLMSLVDLANVNLGLSVAYTDHDADLPLLKTVGKPIAVSPTAKLRDIANKENWQIVNW